MQDSWEYEERPEEGLLLKEATQAGVKNVARYYHHETVLGVSLTMSAITFGSD